MTKKQPSVTVASYGIAKYVPATNMPTKLDMYTMYVKYLMVIHGDVCVYMRIYVVHIRSLESNM